MLDKMSDAARAGESLVAQSRISRWNDQMKRARRESCFYANAKSRGPQDPCKELVKKTRGQPTSQLL